MTETEKKKTKEQELKDECLEIAQDCATEAINNAWSEFWKARNRAEKEGKEEYSGSIRITIKNKGDGKANVGAKAGWGEQHTLTIQDKEVDVNQDNLPGVFDKPGDKSKGRPDSEGQQTEEEK